MNTMQAFYKILDFIPQNVADIVEDAQKIKEDLSNLKEISTPKNPLNTFQTEATQKIESLFDEAPTQIETLFTNLEKELTNNSLFSKIKNQDLTDLLSFHFSADMDDISFIITEKIKALETFLAPLNIPNATAFFDRVEHIANEVVSMLNNIDGETIDEANITKIQEEIIALINIVFGINIPTSIENKTNTILTEAETTFPKVEQELQTIEKDGLNTDNITNLISTLTPVIQKVLGSISSTNPISQDKINTVLTEIITEFQSIDFSKTDLTINTGLEALITLLNKYIPTTSSFSPIIGWLQKGQSALNFLIVHHLIVPIKIKKLDTAPNPNQPNSGGLGQEWAQIQAAQQAMNHQKTTSPNTSVNQVEEKTPVNSVTPQVVAATAPPTNTTTEESNNTTKSIAPTITNATTTQEDRIEALRVLEGLINEGYNELTSTQQDLANSFRNGTAFQNLLAPLQNLENSIIPLFTNLLENFALDMQNQTTLTLNTLVSAILTNIKALVTQLLDSLETILNNLITLITNGILLLINWGLNINLNIPVSKTDTSGKVLSTSTVNCNLLCLTLAIPMDVYQQIQSNNN